ncbi:MULTISPECIES: GNAT family N-acetyltransferase [Clostridium]|jgi:ribosomal-protein-alanine N-acetyltransferase|uniref:GNAT family N-acetyltransferase n=1 Tax=Clostridium TaxID=1485 RepID=UPI000983B9F4|nr:MULTISPECIES: GNAT family N-acetyltransferase [Clostridium]AQR95697.1 putative ribosomal N-acetyltransferase YdaF [Clostridium saccharoperbutylacetonicum]NSB31560.1 ribosomal-protein-alanine N-acetyltransferase [Clostridium saccharoperbutylacetonicum]
MLNHKGTQIIETTKFILRPFRVYDIFDMYYNWASDKEVTKYLTWEEHDSINKTKVVISIWKTAYQSLEYYNWAIEDKSTGSVIGSINLMNLDNFNENCEVGFCIGKEFWNKGIMTEVLNTVLDFAFMEINFYRITARRHINNLASGMVLKKCNFVYEGILRKIVKNNLGVFVDCKYYSIIKPEYIELEKAGNEKKSYREIKDLINNLN